MSEKFQDLYLLLDVPPTATQEELNRAWKRMMKKCHPDHNIGEADYWEGRCKIINGAYETLRHAHLRAEFDAARKEFYRKKQIEEEARIRAIRKISARQRRRENELAEQMAMRNVQAAPQDVPEEQAPTDSATESNTAVPSAETDYANETPPPASFTDEAAVADTENPRENILFKIIIVGAILMFTAMGVIVFMAVPELRSILSPATPPETAPNNPSKTEKPVTPTPQKVETPPTTEAPAKIPNEKKLTQVIAQTEKPAEKEEKNIPSRKEPEKPVAETKKDETAKAPEPSEIPTKTDIPVQSPKQEAQQTQPVEPLTPKPETVIKPEETKPALPKTPGKAEKPGTPPSAPAVQKIPFSPFGIPGNDPQVGLKGTYYDLKEKSDGSPSPMESSSNEAQERFLKLGRQFVRGGWIAPGRFRPYLKGSDHLFVGQIFVPPPSRPNSDDVPTAFGLKGKKGSRYYMHYKGTVIPNKSGRIRLLATADDIICVRVAGKVVADSGYDLMTEETPLRKGFETKEVLGEDEPLKSLSGFERTKFRAGPWFNVHSGSRYQIDVLLGETPGIHFFAALIFEVQGKKRGIPEGKPILMRFSNEELPPELTEGTWSKSIDMTGGGWLFKPQKF